jgi:hypothetical protein
MSLSPERLNLQVEAAGVRNGGASIARTGKIAGQHSVNGLRGERLGEAAPRQARLLSSRFI